MINETTGRPSTPSLVADAIAQLGRLVETEIRLVRTELGEKIADGIRAIVMLVVSAILLVAALIFLLQGCVDLLIYFGMQPFAAAFTVGVAIAIVGGVVIWLALRMLSAENLKPKKAISQISKDATVIKEQVS